MPEEEIKKALDEIDECEKVIDDKDSSIKQTVQAGLKAIGIMLKLFSMKER